VLPLLCWFKLPRYIPHKIYLPCNGNYQFTIQILQMEGNCCIVAVWIRSCELEDSGRPCLAQNEHLDFSLDFECCHFLSSTEIFAETSFHARNRKYFDCQNGQYRLNVSLAVLDPMSSPDISLFSLSFLQWKAFLLTFANFSDRKSVV
jgi:hypothetical protein